MRRRSFAGFSTALALPAVQAQTDTMSWQVHAMPPFFAYRNGQRPQRIEDLSGEGTVDSFMRLLLPLLPQYRHEFVDVTAARAAAMAREGRPLCSLLHLRLPARLGERYFTPAYPIVRPLQPVLVVHREQRARFAALGQPLSLTALLQREDFSGIYAIGRSFGAEIDRLIRSQPGTRPALQGLVTGRYSNVLTMLRARRMDYALDYPQPVDDYLQSVGAPGELVCLPFAEAPQLTMVYASCTRSEAGLRQMEAIDAAIRELAQPRWRKALQQGLREQDFSRSERSRIDHYLDERARGGAQIE